MPDPKEASSPSKGDMPSETAPFRSTPSDTTGMPPGVPYIIGNEAAERFSYYGMRGILTIFMTEHLRNAAGGADMMSDEEAKQVYHIFSAMAYFFPIFGSLISDILWGKYRTILLLSLGYCIGHLCLAMGDTGLGAGLLEPRNWLFLGLAFIAIGAGGIKPCVSAHVGDQFGPRNQGLLSKTFSWFYFSINVGAATSNLLTPYLLESPHFGPAYAFGLPGGLMALATLLFWMGRHRFIHIPPAGAKKFAEETFDTKGLRALANLAPLFLIFVPMFWSLFDQTGSEWVLQAKRLDRSFLGIEWYEAQVQAVNPILILILIPLFAYVVYPAMARLFEPTPLRKIGIGLFLAAVAFGVSGWIESRLSGGAIQSFSSQADRDHWRAIHLLDGQDRAPCEAWLSRADWQTDVGPEAIEGAAATEPHQIIIRLRDYQSWPIEQIVFYPLSDDDQAPEPNDPSKFSDDVSIRLRSPELCRAKTIKVFAADAPKPADGRWAPLAEADLPATAEATTLSFPATTAKYVKLVIEDNHGGAFTGLAEVKVLAAPRELTDDSLINVAGLGDRPTIGWQFLAYLIMTASEVMVSIVCLEFAYTQAPKKMKSFIMGVYFLGVSLGNLLTSCVNWFIANDNGTTKLEGLAYYQFFTVLMFVTACAYVYWSRNYRGQTYIQGDEDRAGAAN